MDDSAPDKQEAARFPGRVSGHGRRLPAGFTTESDRTAVKLSGRECWRGCASDRLSRGVFPARAPSPRGAEGPMVRAGLLPA